MIDKLCFTKEWLETVKQEHPQWSINPPLWEKMIHALSLVELLAQYDLNFIFKGGTSLVLLLDTPKRFSIDIDIITTESREKIETILTKICQEHHFSDWLLDEERSYNQDIPKAHYELFFDARDNKNAYILLDILFEDNPYPVTNLCTIDRNWLKVEQPLTPIQLPSVEAITGDKLTAFAPKTIGILYSFLTEKGVNKSTEIIKQLFDIGQLFDKIQHFEHVAHAFREIEEKERTYRRNMRDKTIDTVFDDILETCLMIAKFEDKDKSPAMEEIRKGIYSFNSWSLISFRKDQVQEAVGKVAYLILKIKNQDTNTLSLFHESLNKSDYLIPNDSKYNYLNKKLKNIPNGALFYWFHVVKMLETKP
jgi:predicted nucleotidyltransferase component of viral defense system